MPHIAANPERLTGRVVGNGHCVAYVREIAGMPHTSRWYRGKKVRGSHCDSGTIIATFDADTGRYGNHVDGRSHAAVLVAETAGGLTVYDQWVGQPVHQRTLHFRAGQGVPVNDGDVYFTVELLDD